MNDLLARSAHAPGVASARPFALAACIASLAAAACGGHSSSGPGPAGGGPPACGNGVLDPGEQCDDANGTPHNLDGCDASCRYEMFLRMTSFTIASTAAPAACTPASNALGTQVLTSAGLGQLDALTQSAVNAGSVNVLLQLLGLDDLAGVSDADGFEVGVLAGTPDPAKGPFPGDTVDWWFLVNAQDVDANLLPVNRVGHGTLAARQLAAGPSDVTLPFFFGGGTAPLRVRAARMMAVVGAAADVPAPPPPLLAPGVAVLRNLGGSGAGQGLCGDVTVESLAAVPVPASLASACGACTGSKVYVACGAGQPVGPGCNSLLDVFVGGCKALACAVAVVNPTQPDSPATSGGTVATLTPGAGNKVPEVQTAGNLDGYSSYFQFDADRVHATGKTP
jgi:cysteine-rich repeat protein